VNKPLPVHRDPAAGQRPPGRPRGLSQDIGLSSGQANSPGPHRQRGPVFRRLERHAGLNSLSGVIPNLGNAASVVPTRAALTGPATSGNGSLTGAAGNLVPGNGPGGLNSASKAVGGVTAACPAASCPSQHWRN